MLYMVTLTISIPQMVAYIPYMDPMGIAVFSWGYGIQSLGPFNSDEMVLDGRFN